MANLHLLLTIVAFFVTIAVAQQPHPEIVLDSMGFTTHNTEYFGEWKGKLEPGGQVFDIEMPVAQDLPEGTHVWVVINYNGEDVLKFDKSFCDMLDDDKIAPKVLDYATGGCATSCPYSKCSSKIAQCPVLNDMLPPDTKPGPIIVTIIIKLTDDEDGEPALVMTAEGEIIVVT